MRSITIHDRDAVGLSAGGTAVTPDHTADFEEFCGTWNQQETDAFLAAVSENRKIDPEDWNGYLPSSWYYALRLTRGVI